jgi:branched-chain amino acid aminotransferase
MHSDQGLTMSKGTHDYLGDARNDSIRISVNGELFARDEARVSVFDSGFVLGDGVWEGLRLHDGGLPLRDQHLDRL